MPAAVSHGSLTVTISEQPEVSQPAPLSDGVTTVVPRTDIAISEEGSSMFLFEPGTSLDEIVQAVNRVGAAPGDLVAILEALKQAGALRAELDEVRRPGNLKDADLAEFQARPAAQRAEADAATDGAAPADARRAGVLALLIFWRHRGNIARIRAGTEPKIGQNK